MYIVSAFSLKKLITALPCLPAPTVYILLTGHMAQVGTSHMPNKRDDHVAKPCQTGLPLLQ